MRTSQVYAAGATADITPSFQVELGCGQGDEAPWRVDDPIEINFLALCTDDDAPVVLVSADVLYIGPVLEEIVIRALGSLPRERVFIAASHTHAAPMTDPTKPALGRPDHAYLAMLDSKIREIAEDLLDQSRYVPVTLRAAKGKANHSINRRQWQEGSSDSQSRAALEPNPKGVRDETITVLEAIGDDGNLLGFVWNYACHPVAYPRGMTVSAHYPGVVREQLRKEHGREVPILFFQGFSGNTRPRFLVDFPSLDRKLWAISRLRSQPLPQWRPTAFDHYRTWANSLASAVKRISDRTRSFAVAKIDAVREEFEGDAFASPTPVPVSFQSISIGKQFKIIGVSAEPVAEYSLPLRRAIRSKWVMAVGCLDTPFGYAPTQSMLAEGGYEVEGFLEAFELESLNREVEQSMKRGFSAVN